MSDDRPYPGGGKASWADVTAYLDRMKDQGLDLAVLEGEEHRLGRLAAWLPLTTEAAAAMVEADPTLLRLIRRTRPNPARIGPARPSGKERRRKTKAREQRRAARAARRRNRRG